MIKNTLLFLFVINAYLFGQFTSVDLAKLFGIETNKPFEIILISGKGGHYSQAKTFGISTNIYSFFSTRTTKIIKGKLFKYTGKMLTSQPDIKITISDKSLELNESGVDMFGSFNRDKAYLSLETNSEWIIQDNDLARTW